MGGTNFEVAARIYFGQPATSPIAETQIRKRLQESEIGQVGLTEVDQILSLVSAVLPDVRVIFDPFIARGLSYYTGPIFEIFTSDRKSVV